jgi:hypothetical protein
MVTTEVVKGWRTLEGLLVQDGHPELARHVNRFIPRMPQPMTEKEQLTQRMLEHSRLQRVKENPIAR